MKLILFDSLFQSCASSQKKEHRLQQKKHGPAAPNAAVKHVKGRRVMKVKTPGGRGRAEAKKVSPAQAKFSGPASDQMAAAMKLLSETVSQAMMGGLTGLSTGPGRRGRHRRKGARAVPRL